MSSQAPLRVLYIHPVAAFGGAARSLLELLRGFPQGAVKACVLAPRGPAAEAFAALGAEVLEVAGLAQFDCTRFGHYRGLRWLIVLRELWLLPGTLLGVLRARRRWPRVDLIHANEVTLLPAALAAKALYRRPLVVHVRSVQLSEGAPVRRALVQWLLRRFADAVVAIDDTVRASLPERLSVDVVRNGFSAEGAQPAPAGSREGGGALRVGSVGTLLPLKGVRELLEAARTCAARGSSAQFFIAGSNPRDLSRPWGRLMERLGFAYDMEREIREFISAHGLQASVHPLGFVRDVATLYGSLDVVCFPSHLGATGRPVIEAAWLGVPAIAAAAAAPDAFIPGETGLAVPARDPEALAAAILQLDADRAALRRLGEAARRLAEKHFDSRRNAGQMLSLYERLLDQRKRATLAA